MIPPIVPSSFLSLLSLFLMYDETLILQALVLSLSLSHQFLSTLLINIELGFRAIFGNDLLAKVAIFIGKLFWQFLHRRILHRPNFFQVGGIFWGFSLVSNFSISDNISRFFTISSPCLISSSWKYHHQRILILPAISPSSLWHCL